MKKGCSIIAVIGLIVFLIGGYFAFNFLKKYKLGNVAKEGYILVPTGANFEQVLDSISPYLKNKEHPISVIIGSSIGAINGLVLAACLKEGIEESVRELELMWRERTFRNTFRGSPGMAFLRAIKVAFLQYLSPGPKADGGSVFDPSPLMERVDGVIKAHGGLTPAARAPRARYRACRASRG